MYDSYYNWNQGYAYVVQNSNHWVYAGTGFSEGDAVPGIVGYEWDRQFNNGFTPAGLVTLSNSPVKNVSNVSSFANSSIYQATSGAWVFNAGTVYWTFGCDFNPFQTRNLVDSRIQQTTKNILNKFVTSNGTNPPGNTAYTYNLPLVTNQAHTALGQTTTFVTFQNLSGSATANISVQYYGVSDGVPGPNNSLTIPAKGQQAILPNIPLGSNFGGVITSDQPLNLVVSENYNSGGSAYNISAQTAAILYSPLALNGQYGFVTSIVVFNAASTGNATGTLRFFDENGNLASAATQNFNLPAHASQTFNQAAAGSGLTSSHTYWAEIIADSSSASLTAQVIEFGPANFVATFNALMPSQVANTLYAPACFNGQFNFVTGMALANPNNSPANVAINYFDANGALLKTQTFQIPANGVNGVFQPNVVGLSNAVNSAIVNSTQPLIMLVNEGGPGAVAGTYVGLTSGSTNVALPVMSNGYAGFVTGTTVLNIASRTAHLTFTYLNQAGNQVGFLQSKTLAPNASFLVYQGDATQGLPDGFFGTALINSDQPILVTTNALNTATGVFYSYTEPSTLTG